MNVRQLIDVYWIAIPVALTPGFFNIEPQKLYFASRGDADAYIQANRINVPINSTKAFERCYDPRDSKETLAYKHVLFNPMELEVAEKRQAYFRDKAHLTFRFKDKTKNKNSDGRECFIQLSSEAERLIKNNIGSVVGLAKSGFIGISGKHKLTIDTYDLPDKHVFTWFEYFYVSIAPAKKGKPATATICMIDSERSYFRFTKAPDKKHIIDADLSSSEESSRLSM